MWVAFAYWTVFFGASFKDRIKALIGTIIGFLAAVLMMFITSSFSLNIGTISISCLLGVFVVNVLVMYLDKAEKVWLNSISVIFIAIMLTFSGFGIGLNPLNGLSEAGVVLALLLVYGILGLLCGLMSIIYFKKKK